MDMHDKAPLVDLAEAVHEGWLELWYQPKIDARAIVMRGVEGLLRVRHPSWGILSPTYFIANDGDPRLRSVSETVIKCAIDDWYRFFGERGPVEIAINLPIAFLQDTEVVGYLDRNLPNQAAFERLVVEINGTDVVRNLALAKNIARALRSSKIAISLDDVGVEWTSLTDLRDFPFAEVKVDQSFIKGCAHDAVKQSMCRRIIELANGAGARTVAEGVETWADFLAVRALGFDLVQGFLFAEPAAAEQFARSCWTSTRHYLTSVLPSDGPTPLM
jgi:EAL domain-containing protein (putative c-di-GMP-specific phosphodiesterase class I)